MSNIEVNDDPTDFMTNDMRVRYSKHSSFAIGGLIMSVPSLFLCLRAADANNETLTYIGLGLFLISLFFWISSTYKALRTTGLNPLTLKSNFMTLVIAGLEFFVMAVMFISSGDDSKFAIFAGIMWLLAFGYLIKQNYDEMRSVKLTIAVSAIQFFAVFALGLYLFYKFFGPSKHQKVITHGGRRLD